MIEQAVYQIIQNASYIEKLRAIEIIVQSLQKDYYLQHSKADKNVVQSSNQQETHHKNPTN